MKTKKLTFYFFASACVLLIVVSCSKKEDLSYNTNSRTLDLSQNYSYDLGSDELATLGRVLFYDNTLSVNNSVSCGSCHKQSRAFADTRASSRGFENVETSRNTPPIQNIGGFSLVNMGVMSKGGQALFWDGRERILQNMVMQPVFNHVEMGVKNTGDLVNRVKSRSYYPELFSKAFDDEEITFNRISEAIMWFVRNIQTNHSPFDQLFRNAIVNDQVLNSQEQRGMNLFFGKYNCGSCHQLHSPTGYLPTGEKDNSELLNIGLDQVYTDKGLGGITGKPEDDGKFKIPNLRNIALTAPYMHDGRFETLEEVLDHYNNGVQDNPNLDSRLKDISGKPQVLNISTAEKEDIIAFLHTLTDGQMITDPRLSDPFKKY